MNASTLGFPALRSDRLGTDIPTGTWTRYGRFEPEKTLYLFRSTRFDDGHAAGGMLAFYVDDYRLEGLWTKRKVYLRQLVDQNWRYLVAPNFSLWADDHPVRQQYNLLRSRELALEWQDAGLNVAPDLNWSDERSFEWCFDGIPHGCPVAYCQSRNIREDTSAAFLAGLREALRIVAPQTLVLYGKASWLADSALPTGSTKYVRLPAFIDGMKAGFKARTAASAGPSLE